MRRVRFALSLAIVLAATGVSGAQAAGSHPRDQVVISGSVNVPRDRTVGDVVIVDGPVDVAGTVDGDVVAFNGVVRVSGVIRGDLTTFAKRAILAPGARVTGDLRYGDPRPRIAPGATVGGKVSHEGWSDLGEPAFGVLAYVLVWLAISVSALAFGTLVWWLAPRAMASASAAVRDRTGPVVGWGLGLFFGLPAVAVLAAVTLVGLPLGVGLLLALVPLSALGYVTTAWVFGRMAVPRSTGWFVPGLVGLAALRALALVPFLGFLTWLAATVFGLGALLVATWASRTPGGTPTPPAADRPSPGAPAPAA